MSATRARSADWLRFTVLVPLSQRCAAVSGLRNDVNLVITQSEARRDCAVWVGRISGLVGDVFVGGHIVYRGSRSKSLPSNVHLSHATSLSSHPAKFDSGSNYNTSATP